MSRRWSGVGAAALTGYLLGTAPSATVAARLATGGEVDLRSAGTGNPGGMNARNVLGARWGYAVMAADIGKGALACLAGRRLGGDLGAHVAGTAAVVGHCHPVWTGFRGGGKGVGCSVGQVLATFPAYFPVDLAVAGLTASGPWRSRARAGTTVASATWVASALLWRRLGLPSPWGPPVGRATAAAAAVSSAVILDRFRRAP